MVEDKIFANVLLPLMALIAPFLVLLVEIVLPYPYIIEELVKAVLVYQLLGTDDKKLGLKIAIIMGMFFSLSETVLYFFNFFNLTSVAPMIQRLVQTTLLHTLTMVVIYLFARKKKYWLPVGVLLAMLMHYLYNIILVS